MEAVPRLPMLWFPLKSSPESTSFSHLKKYIAEYYQENPDSFSKEVYALETLRNAAMHPPKDVTGCATLKRYYCQLHSLANRFPQVLERNLFTFVWKDLYANNTSEIMDFRYEMAAVLFNIAGHHTQLGALVNRADADGMKLACTHFQIAAWSYGELREKYQGINANGDFMTPELLLFMQQVSFAHAQECILEKSLIDNRKPAIVAKVTAQIVSYYGAALAALLSGGDDGTIADFVGNSVFKTWTKYVRFKIAYLNSILFLYQGQQAEEQQKMGERVTLYQAAWDNLEEARKESKGLDNQPEIMEALTFTADVVEGKRKAGKNENDFIYHEAVPELKDISAVQGANLVNGINFSVTDPEVAGEDIFARLIPMKAHEASSMYSEEKANLLRQIGAKVTDKDNELDGFMSSLNIENLNVSEERANKIPQGIVDRCASINAKPNAIPNLITSMGSLAEICADVETSLKEIRDLLDKEEANEKKFQQESGVHRNNVHFAELSREFQKYLEAHQKAGDSNDTLRRAMELHVNNLRILAKPLQEIQQDVPKLSGEVKEDIFHDLKLILNKVNEMKAQRAQFCADLRIAINDDDITSQIIAFGEENDMKELFNKEIAKHDKLVALIEQNLKAQVNILAALTEQYAKTAPILKTINDVKHKRDNFFSSLAASYDVYEDLLAKSAKGLEFYKKLQGNVQKLLARVKAACDVQNEERQQRMSSTSRYKSGSTVIMGSNSSHSKSTAPKLKDFLKNNKLNTAETFIPPIRPSPLGSEAPPSAACVTSNPAYYTAQSQLPPMTGDYPPPPYTPPTQQYYDSNGYTNPIYQHNQMPAVSTVKYDYNYPVCEQPPQYQSQIPTYPNVASGPVTTVSNNSIPPGSNPSAQIQPQQYQYPVAADPSTGIANQRNNMYPYTSQPVDMSQQYTNQNANTYAQTHSSSYSAIMTHTSQTPAHNSWTPLAAANAFENHSIQNTGYANQMPSNQEYTNPWSGNTVQQPTLSTPMGYGQTQQTSAAISMGVRDTTMNSWNTAGSNTLSQSTSQLNSTTASYPAYHNMQMSVTQNDPMLRQPQQSQQTQQPQAQQTLQLQTQQPQQLQTQQPQQPQTQQPQQLQTQQPQQSPLQQQSQQQQQPQLQQPIEYIQSHAKTNNSYDIQPAGVQQEAASTYTNTQYSPYMAPTITSTRDSSSISSVEPYINQYGTIIDSTISLQYDQSQTQQAQNLSNNYTQNSNAASTTGYYGNFNSYQDTGMVYPNPDTPSAVDSSNQQFYNNMTPNNPVNYVQNFPNTVTPPQQIEAQQASTYTQPAKDLTTKSQPKPKLNPPKKSSNLDLLSDIDFSANLSTPALQPQLAQTKKLEPILTPEPRTEPTTVTDSTPKPVEPIDLGDLADLKFVPEKSSPATVAPETIQTASNIPSSMDRKSSCDNISLCSDLSSVADHTFDWDSVSQRAEQTQSNFSTRQPRSIEGSGKTSRNPFDDPKNIKYFHKEVERYEKMVESLKVKMLNGNTPLVSKWKELQDLLVRDEAKRTSSIARLFPEKNRSTDCIPFDHARVVLERSTDDYINAAYIKDLGPGCPVFVIAQTPLPNTVNDFWSMIWSQKARTVVCLHTPNEILDTFWPNDFNKEMHFDDFSVTLVKQFDLSHCIELNLKLTLNGADAILDLSLIQIKAWTKSSPAQILGIAQNVIVAYKQRSQEFNSTAPLIMNCLTGSERSGLIALAICAILATQSKRPILINAVDVWHRICSQRKSALRDTNNLELSMQIILSHGHDLLNKRGIMTSYQMKNIQKTKSIEKEVVKDPLNDLDPLWKLKPKS